MEDSLSMPEFTSLLVAKREKDYEDKKFVAAIQGIDLDKESGKEDAQKAWEDMKARVFSGGTAQDSNDIVSLQGINADKAGFGIGQGLEYESVKDTKNPLP
jgi:translation initiation factor 1 (eIF-1/SUI1)